MFESFIVFFVIATVLGCIYIIFIEYTSPSGFKGGAIPVSNVLSHWSHPFRSFSMSSNEFYQKLENELKEQQMPHAMISRTRHKEGGMLSASREYLRIKHGDLVFDVCAAPFGKHFFMSWWLYETAGTMRTLFKNTKVGNFLQARAQRRTFYQIDEEEMFRSFAHQCIIDIIEQVGEEKGYTRLTDAEKAFKMGGV